MTASDATEGSGKMTGYSVLQGETLSKVARIFKGHLHLGIKGATIEVVEVMPLPGQ